MAKKIVNIGVVPNDGKGDPIRDAFDKINDNFDEIYARTITPEDFGAVGDGETDDGESLMQMFEYVNSMRGGCKISFGAGKVYLFSPPSRVVYRNTSGPYTLTLNPYLVGCDNVVIEGNGATLLVADDSTPVDNSQAYTEGMAYGILNIFFCNFVTIRDLKIDGNRYNQTHTAPEASDTGANNGIAIDSMCRDIVIDGVGFYRLGTLRSGADKRGDGVYISNGAQRVTVRNCTFYDYGRWAVTLERPRTWYGPNQDYRYDEAEVAYIAEYNQVVAGTLLAENASYRTDGIYVENNTFLPLVVGSDYIALGSIDIESYYFEQQNIYITGNRGIGRTNIAFGGARDEAEYLYVRNVYITDNIIDFDSAFTSSRDTFVRFSGGNSSTETWRIWQNFNVCRNNVTSGASFFNGTNGSFIDLTVSHNVLRPPRGYVLTDGADPNDVNFVSFTEASFAGYVCVTNNQAINSNLLYVYKVMAFHAPFDSEKFIMTIANNALAFSSKDPEYVVSQANYPVNMTWDKDGASTYPVVSGSEIHFAGNVMSLNQVVDRPLDESSVFSSASSNGVDVYLYDNNYMGLTLKAGAKTVLAKNDLFFFSEDGRTLFANNNSQTVVSGGAWYWPWSFEAAGTYRFVPRLATAGAAGAGSDDKIRVYICELVGETAPADPTGLADGAARLAEFLARVEDSNLSVIGYFEAQADRLDGKICYKSVAPIEFDVSSDDASVYFCIESIGSSTINLAANQFRIEGVSFQ